MRLAALLLTWSLAAFTGGQTGDGSFPAPSNVRGAEFPKIHPDLRVTFRLRAPGAQKIQVVPQNAGLGKSPFEMTRGEDGLWTVTTPPVRPGFHYYHLLVDGVPVNDPGSETYFGWAKETSGLEVPDPALDFYEAKPVPHGEVWVRYYHAKTTGALRRAYVYTPPDYDAHPKARYPVLYLQHGSGESERAWTTQGRANFILDNLIAAGKARPMILIMENGYAAKIGAPPSSAGRGTEGFQDLVLHDLIPLIDSTYRTLADRKHRAIAGLSMGAGQALEIALANPDKFGCAGAFSGAGRSLDVKAARAANFRLLWLGCGVEDRLYAGGKAIHAALDQAGVKHVWFEGPGEHEWQVWRKHLAAFAPLLFR
jgi:enterochelin esterase-like enzyme